MGSLINKNNSDMGVTEGLVCDSDPKYTAELLIQSHECLLSEEQEADLHEHLKKCERCRTEYESLSELDSEMLLAAKDDDQLRKFRPSLQHAEKCLLTTPQRLERFAERKSVQEFISDKELKKHIDECVYCRRRSIIIHRRIKYRDRLPLVYRLAEQAIQSALGVAWKKVWDTTLPKEEPKAPLKLAAQDAWSNMAIHDFCKGWPIHQFIPPTTGLSIRLSSGFKLDIRVMATRATFRFPRTEWAGKSILLIGQDGREFRGQLSDHGLGYISDLPPGQYLIIISTDERYVLHIAGRARTKVAKIPESDQSEAVVSSEFPEDLLERLLEDVGKTNAPEDKKGQEYLKNARKLDLWNLLTKRLTRAERLILVMYYYEEMTMREIGVTLGLSESRVSQMRSSIITRLRAQMGRYEQHKQTPAGRTESYVLPLRKPDTNGKRQYIFSKDIFEESNHLEPELNTLGSLSVFPSVSSLELEEAKGHDENRRRIAIGNLIERFWKPIYCWLLRSGYNDADAKDLVQDFFLYKLCQGQLVKAYDPARGRFRAYLLMCLKNFVANYERDMKGRSRQLYEPMVEIDEFETSDIVQLVDSETPEDCFNRAWAQQLLLRALKALEQECLKMGKEHHYKLFYRRIVDPLLESKPQPPIKELAEEMGITTKQASNYIITARRAYHRLLRAEIRIYASSDDEVNLEIENMFTSLGNL